MGGLFLDNGYSAEKFQYAYDIVKSIAVKASEMHMDGVLESENEVLESLGKDKEKLAKGSEKLEKEIKKAKDLIKDSEDEIQNNIKVMKSKTDEIEAQRQKVIMLQNVKKSIN
ncbi:hypothetical protein [Flavobacterium sp. Arc2]|jgi:ElaB/YqjD/DUF883 family membrane-anchored ribosome-binding protein|uniref:hypothetical protein n=1 Tax=Flavobacterium sp. Arc2 TaxID=3046685 RepID=UPI00352D6EEC